MSRSFAILQGTNQLAADREAERAANDRAASEPVVTRPAAKVYEKRFGLTAWSVFVLLGCAGGRRAELAAVGLFPYVGVEPWTGAGVARPLSTTDELTQLLASHVPATVIQHSVMVQGWRLDRDRLVTAVKGFAPSVEIVELS